MAQDEEDSSNAEPRKRFKEFDCPECSANNPMDDGFYSGDEIRCLYCGIEFKVMPGEGKLKLREL